MANDGQPLGIPWKRVSIVATARPSVCAAAVPATKSKGTTKTRKATDDEEEEEEDDDVDPDDVEADLDAILKDRIAAQPEDEDEDEDEVPEVDDRGDGAGRIQPKKADEFVCQSCFLVKHRSQIDHETKVGPICLECAS